MKLRNFLNLIIFLTITISVLITSCGKQTPNEEEVKKMEQELKNWIDKYYEKVKPLTKDAYLAYFNQSIVSTPENTEKYANLMKKVNAIYSNKEEFEQLKKIKESGLVQDSIMKRDLDILYLTFLSKQVDTNKLNEITEMEAKLEGKYSKFRAIVGKDSLTDNQVEEILMTSKDNSKLEAVWKVHKSIGKEVAEDIIELVKKRNELAKTIGYANFHEMSLKLSEQDPKEIESLFDELDKLTHDAFANEKGKMDKILAKELNIKEEELMPWDYQNRYFQEAPKIYEVDLDKYYKEKDVVKLTEDYYKSINLDLGGILTKSDLYEKPGKNQHAYCINIDRDERDIRVLCNVVNNSKWMNTMLHECGHALYENYLDQKLPWDLKVPTHIFATEAIAMLFGRFSSYGSWMEDMKLIDREEKSKISEAAFNTLKLEQLVFSRWAQVMYRFEKSMYENPTQDLNKLWWDMVEKYQMLKRPANRNEPDWATKYHIALSPCYYHNYLMGELFASQLYYYISEKILNGKAEDKPSFYNQPKAGAYLIEKVFIPGNRYYWNVMVERATGEKLTPKYYAKQFVSK